MNIGRGFNGKTESGKDYINIAFEKSLLELVPVLKNVNLTLWYVPKSERKSEDSPAWSLSVREKFQKDTSSKTAGNTETTEETEEILF